MGITSLTSHASGKKHSEIQISQSSNIGAVFFGKSNKDPASKKKVKKVKEQWKVFQYLLAPYKQNFFFLLK